MLLSRAPRTEPGAQRHTAVSMGETQGWGEHEMWCKLWGEIKIKNQHLSRFAKFQVLTSHSQRFLFSQNSDWWEECGMEKPACLTRVSTGEFSAGGTAPTVNTASHTTTIRVDRLQDGHITLSPACRPLFPLLEVRDPL